MRVSLAIPLMLWGQAVLAQGYGGLGVEAPGFKVPDPDYEINFPKDNGAHEGFRIEWWYLTANLMDSSGVPLGIQWTLFRSARAPDAGTGWNDPNIWMAHAALTTSEGHAHGERFARGGTGQGGVVAHPFEAWLDHWQLTEHTPGDFSISASEDGFSFELQMKAKSGAILHGNNGYSTKSSDGNASHYFSRVFPTVSGKVRLGDEIRDVTGTAWLDREWSSQPLSGDQSGWDWVGLTLDDGRHLMAARVRQTDENFVFGSLVSADGTVTTLTEADITMTPKGRKSPPTSWSIEVAREGINLQLDALNDNSWMGGLFQYWEGPVRIKGSHGGSGYLEMTGYR